MSTVIRSCPGCKSLILSDTDQCPECGHVFYERRKTESTGVAPSTPDALKSASIHEPCPHCGEMVRAGLVRCWSCNGFMRADVAARYRALTTNPQPIIYSTIPPEKRTDYLPARADASDIDAQAAADKDDFKLGSGVGVASGSDFETDSGFSLAGSSNQSSAATPAAGDSSSTKNKAPKESTPAPAVDGPDKPQSTTQIGGPAADAKIEAAPAAAAEEKQPGAESATGKKSASSSPGKDADLFSIAVEEQKEVKKRRGQKAAERQRKQVLVSCSCGAWIRVNEDQAGKSVRCKQCKQPVVVPGLKKKTEKTDKKEGRKEPVSKLNVSWIDDAWYHVLAPASLVLKPGSLTGKHSIVDLAFTESGLQVLTFQGAATKKRSLFSFVSSGKKKLDHQLRRRQIREQVAASGEFKNLENVEIHSINAGDATEVRLVQPVAKVSESMFAGVPVFGEGRIAVFLPIALDDAKQAFLSFSLSGWRAFSDQMKQVFNVEFLDAENGIPDSEKAETLSCFLNQSKVESLRGLIYYQADPEFKLEMTGYRCKSCGTAVSEEGRKKAKLGGIKGKGIAKAKCPKCSGKMQGEALFKIASAAEPTPNR